MRISYVSSDVCSSDLARILVELAHQPQRTLEFGGDIGIEFDRWLEPPEQVGRQRKIARFGQPVALAADAGIDPENLLDDDDRRARRAFGARAIRGEIALAVQRRDRQHLGPPCAPRIRRSWSSSHCLVAGPSPAEYAPKIGRASCGERVCQYV